MIEEVIQNFAAFHNSLGDYSILIRILSLTAIIIAYFSFVFYFYRIVSEKNLINLNLQKYRTSEHSFISKFSAVALYIIEYLILMPIFILIWFLILAALLLVVAKTLSVDQILLFSAAIIASVRFAAYINNKMAEDLAKIVPLTILTLAIVGENFFSATTLIQRISELPLLFNNILLYLIFIILLEFFLRIIELPRQIVSNRRAEDSDE